MPGADLGIPLTGPTIGLVDRPHAYVATITNAGPFDASSVTAEVRLPAGGSWVGTTPSQGTCTISGSVLTCELGTVTAGASAQVTFVVAFATPGTYQLAAEVSVGATTVDPTSPNDTAALNVTIGRPIVGQLPDTSTPLGWLIDVLAISALAFGVLVHTAIRSQMRSATRR